MPKRKRSYTPKRSTKRRRFAPKRRMRRPVVPRGLRSQRKVLKLRWNHYNSLNGGTGAVDFHAYRANTIYRPDGTGGDTHSPMFTSQIAALYNHYVVLGAKITVKFLSPTNTTTGALIGGVFLSDDTTFSTNVITLTEQNRSNWRMITPSNNVRPFVVKKKFSAKKFFNVKDVKDNVKRIGAAFGANPSEEAHFITWVGAANGTTDPSPVDTFVTIDYIVLVSEPAELAQS